MGVCINFYLVNQMLVYKSKINHLQDIQT